ncbi:MAG: tandem-95 repeat protein [Gammaproteobacteria bacterium]|nr:tandem-95 repeat protein [Gammaproteobacteria bacterium]
MSVRFPALMITLLALTACGGGSSGGGSGDTSPQAGSSTFITQENTPGTGLFNATVAAGRTPTYTIVQNGTRGTAVVSDQAAGEFTYTPNVDVTGSDAFTYKVNDGVEDSNVAVVSVVIVKSAPIAVDDAVTMDEDTPVTVDVLANDSGNGHPLDTSSVTLVLPPARGNATVNPGGNITYAPAANANGTDSFTYTVKNDAGGTSNAARVTLTITPANDPPVVADDNFAVLEDSTTSLAVLTNNGNGVDADPDGDALTISAVGVPDNGGNVGINGAQTALIYAPAADFFGTETFTYTVSDGHGGFDTATVAVIVAPVNDDPAARDDAFSVAEDSTTTLSVLADNGNGADLDIDGGALTIVGVSLTSQGGSLSLNAGNTALIYTPTADFFGIETFTYTVSDGQGGTDSAIATVTVTPVNDPPVARDDDLIVAEDSTTLLALLADNGNGPDTDVDGGTLVITDVGITSQGGDAVINGAGDAVMYSPAADFFGTETFTYTVSDGQGGTDTALVTMTVTAINDAPIGRDDVFTVAFNSSNNTLAVLADNGSGADTDADNDEIAVVSAGTPDHGGSVSPNPAQDALIYTPPAGFIGNESFTYTISDGNGGVDTAAVTVNSAFTDNFSSGTANWTFVSDSGSSSSWTTVSGALRQLNRVESVNAFDQSFHKGTYAYYTAGTSLTNYRFSADALYLGAGLQDDIGVMFRYQNSNNYYRLSMNTRYGFTRLEKKVAGIFTPLAVNARGYDDGQVLNFTIEVQGALIRIWINGDPAFALQDASLGSGSVALYTQDTASFDNVRIEGIPADPSVVLATPVAQTVETSSSLSVSAIAGNVPAGGGVEFLLDGTDSVLDTSFPYQAAFTGVPPGDHTVEAVLRDASNVELARDTNALVGAQGRYFLAFGDSIMNGEDDNYAADNQNGRILGSQGIAANLAGLLESSLADPVIVYNEGIGGDESADAAFTRVDSIIERHPGAQDALVMLGTNDSLASIPSGSGCSGGACSGTFKGNMQSLANTLAAAGSTVYIATPPPVFGVSTPFANPAAHATNTRIQQYRTVITTELSNTEDGPDFYDYFLGAGDNRFSLFSDIWHPNALGHVVMAHLWHNAINPGDPVSLPFILNDLAPSTISPYLKQNLIEVGDEYYIDRSYTLNGIPAGLADGIWVMTANGDSGNTSASYLTFNLDRAATVYIAYDAGATTTPDWMSAFTDTGLILGTTDPFSPALEIYSRTYAAGPVSLGGNLASGASGSNSNYLVIVKPN